MTETTTTATRAREAHRLAAALRRRVEELALALADDAGVDADHSRAYHAAERAAADIGRAVAALDIVAVLAEPEAGEVPYTRARAAALEGGAS